MNRILITTQVIENYDVDGNAATPDGYWKFNGGAQYIVLIPDERVANAVAFLTQRLHTPDLSRQNYLEIVKEWEVIGEDWQPAEEWMPYPKILDLAM